MRFAAEQFRVIRGLVSCMQWLRVAFDDSRSEYLPVEDRHTVHTSTRWETKEEKMRTKVTGRQSRINIPGDNG